MLTITTDAKRVRSKVRQLERSLGRTSVRSAMNAAIRSTRGEAKKQANAQLALAIPKPATWIQNQIKMDLATASRLRAQIRIDDRKIPLAKFKGYRQTPTGVEARIWKSGGKSVLRIRHGFDMPGRTAGQNQLAMIRQRKGGKLVARLPIRRLWGPGIVNALKSEEKQLVKFLGDRYQVEIRRKIRGALARQGAFN